MKNTINNTTNSSVYRKAKIREIIKNNRACIICIRRWRGRIKTYKTTC